MTVNNKRVFYVKYLAHQIYADISRRADVRLDRLENESTEEVSAPILRPRTPTRSARRATRSIRFSTPMPTCCAGRPIF